MARKKHPSKDIENALQELESLGWQVEEAKGRSAHSWGGDVSKACWFLLCSDASVGYAEASEAQGDPPCPVLIRPNSAACSPA